MINPHVVEPSLYDGALYGILTTPNAELWLFCETAEGETLELRLPGLMSLRCDNFREGNIIFEVNESRSAAPIRLLRQVLGYDEAYPEQPPEIPEGEWTLFEVTSSFGCELRALAKGRTTIVRGPRQQGAPPYREGLETDD
jgi:hypothetical protein